MLRFNYNEENSIYSSRIKDNDNNIILEVPVPGFDKKELNISVKDGYLILEGKNDEFRIDKSYRVSDAIDIENISADIKNGVLQINLPKASPNIKEITIN